MCISSRTRWTSWSRTMSSASSPEDASQVWNPSSSTISRSASRQPPSSSAMRTEQFLVSVGVFIIAAHLIVSALGYGSDRRHDHGGGKVPRGKEGMQLSYREAGLEG